MYCINLEFNSAFICIEICKRISVYNFQYKILGLYIIIIIYFAKAFVLLITKVTLIDFKNVLKSKFTIFISFDLYIHIYFLYCICKNSLT